MFDSAETINNLGLLDTDIIEDYIEALGGTIGSDYAEPDGRINMGINTLEYVPLRATFEALGCEVSWNAETPDCAYVTIDGTEIMFRDKSSVVSAEGKELELGLETYMENGVTYISSEAVELCTELYG